MRRAWCVHFRRGGMRRNFNLIDCDLKSSSHVCVCVRITLSIYKADKFSLRNSPWAVIIHSLSAIAPSRSPHAVYWQIFFQSATFGKYENTEKKKFPRQCCCCSILSWKSPWSDLMHKNSESGEGKTAEARHDGKDLRRHLKLVLKSIWRGPERSRLRIVIHDIRFPPLISYHIGNDYRLLRQPNQLHEAERL